MKRRFIALGVVVACAAVAVIALIYKNKNQDMENNPFLTAYTTPYEIPPFDQIEYKHYLPALEAGIEQKKAEIEAITSNADEATFENTIMPLERSEIGRAHV